MNTSEKINQLSKEETIWVYREFLKKMMAEIEVSPAEILNDYLNIPGSDKMLADIASAEPDKLDTTRLSEEDSYILARQLLIGISKDDALEIYLQEFLETEKEETMGISAEILSIGFVLISAIVATSIEVKDGKFSYSSGNISENAVQIVKSIMENMSKIMRG